MNSVLVICGLLLTFFSVKIENMIKRNMTGDSTGQDLKSVSEDSALLFQGLNGADNCNTCTKHWNTHA